MTKEKALKAECDRLTAEFEKLYGQKHLIIGRAEGYTYVSFPEDTAELSLLVERLLMAMVIENKHEHLAAAIDALYKVLGKLEDAAEKTKLN